jgi:protein Tex
MVLEGVVTNVAAFGAFVDIGVHQDGLVHVSAMSRTFVSDPREVARPGDVVRVKVLGVDVARQRISLTLRLDDEPDRGGERRGGARSTGKRGGDPRGGDGRDGRKAAAGGAMADALRRAGLAGRPGHDPPGRSGR